MYHPVVGLEVHLQVKTESKMFCRCSTDYFNREPNINCCPVCFGLPGGIPVPNKVAFDKCLKLAIALNCKINQVTKFDRKNYFYPDLPKGYQISQYDQPIGVDGYVEIEVDGDSRRVRLQRIHLEEDVAKSIHTDNDESLIDYNKSGIPLIEMVTYPDFEGVEEILAFAKRLRQIVRYLDISDAEMQKGQMRFELNMSLRDENSKELPNYKVEIKNIGSISVLEKVMKYEIDRQGALLDKGEKMVSQTRGLNGMSGETVFQRAKETADDYRYFPEPDIPPIKILDEQIELIRSNLIELPSMRKQRYMNLGLEGEQADIFVEDNLKGDWFDKAIYIISKKRDSIKFDLPEKEVAKWLIGDISGWIEKKSILDINLIPVSQEDLITLVSMIKSNQISGTIAKDVISEVFQNGGSVLDLIKTRNLIQISDDSEVDKIVTEVIELNAKVISDISRNPNAIKFLVGQVMRTSKGKVNPKIAEEVLRKKLNI